MQRSCANKGTGNMTTVLPIQQHKKKTNWLSGVVACLKCTFGCLVFWVWQAARVMWLGQIVESVHALSQ